MPEALAADLALEQGGRAAQVEAIGACETARDFVTREVLVRILEDTEEHIDYLEKQLELIEALGRPNYLQSAIGPLDKVEAQAE